MMILALALLAFGVWFVMKGHAPQPQKAKISAIDILKERYAAGQISREEYLSMLDDLR